MPSQFCKMAYHKNFHSETTKYFVRNDSHGVCYELRYIFSPKRSSLPFYPQS